MTSAKPLRGGAPVGYISELNAIEAGAVLYLRLWSDGPDALHQIWADFSRTLGEGQGRMALKSLEQLCSMCARYGRRPLMRHHVTCQCLGADEACFANFVAAASDGEHEDAMLMAMIMVRPDMAACLVGLAESVGLALKQMCLTVPADPKTNIERILH